MALPLDGDTMALPRLTRACHRGVLSDRVHGTRRARRNQAGTHRAPLAQSG